VTSVQPAGVREALASLLESEGDRLFALALRVTRDPDLAADAVQAGFASALEASRDFRGEAALSTWLHRIVYNAAIDQLRRRGRETQLPEDPDLLSDDDARLARAPSWARPERPLATAELRRALDDAFAALTPLQRAVFEMHEEEGRATEQVAEALGLTPGAVRVHLHRARLRLRARLAETLGRRS
jgi:RNA polymerase sigma-70 factor (ECF subfamily)